MLVSMFPLRTKTLYAHTIKRLKSNLPLRVDEFPYKRLRPQHAHRICADLENQQLPLKTFFSQHLPLRPFDKPAPITHAHADMPTRWIEAPPQHIQSARPGFMDANANHNETNLIVPEPVLRQTGPFDRRLLLNNGRVPHRSVADPSSMLQQRLPALMEYLQRNLNTDGEIHIIPLGLNKLEDIEATSVLRKRKLKMNKHKYKKRMRRERMKRRGPQND